MPTLIPYLSFDGNCAEAMRFYEKVIPGKLIALIRHSDTPTADQVPPENADRIMHAALEFEGGSLFAGDAVVGMGPFEPMTGIMLALNYPTRDEGRRAFDALADGGKVTMPFEETFWADGFGMVTDRYGTHWGINGGQKQMQM